MKTIHSIALLLTILILSSFSESNTKISECGNITLDEELQQLLRSPDVAVKKDSKAIVMLTANDRGELVVVSVKTRNKEIDNYVKERLNYQKLCNTLETGQLYSLPVTVRSGK